MSKDELNKLAKLLSVLLTSNEPNDDDIDYMIETIAKTYNLTQPQLDYVVGKSRQL